MANHAFVIGIDAYQLDNWQLDAAVSDALEFADWAVTDGGVEPGNLRVLLCPKAGAAGLNGNKFRLERAAVDVPFGAACQADITEMIQSYVDGAAKEADRFYFYYAGHGSAAPGSNEDLYAEPVLIPADVETLPKYKDRLVSFNSIIGQLTESPPAEQFFFIDACRDFALEMFEKAAVPAVGRYRGGQLLPAGRKASNQYVIYATSPGRRANEVRGAGVFGRRLMKALRGEAPGAAPFVQASQHDGKPGYELTFRSLFDYVKKAVDEEILRVFPKKTAHQFVQAPQQDAPRSTPNCVIRSFKQLTTQTLTLRVNPKKAREAGSACVLFFGPHGEVKVEDAQPVLPLPLNWTLKPFDYAIRVTAPGFVDYSKACPVYEPCVVDASLEPLVVPAGPTAPAPPEAAESPLAAMEAPASAVIEAPVSPEPARTRSIAPAAAIAPSPGRLVVRTEDPHAIVVVIPPQHGSPIHAYRQVVIEDAAPGIYRAHLHLTSGPSSHEVIEVTPGAQVERLLNAPASSLGQKQITDLASLSLRTSETNYLAPSELLGAVTEANLASLLGFTAYAAYCAPHDRMHRLKGMGLPKLMPVKPSHGLAVVLIGAVGDQPAGGISVGDFLQQSFAVIEKPNPGRAACLSMEVLSGFSEAACAQLSLEQGRYELELRMPAHAPTRYTFQLLSGRATVLTAAVQDNGAVEVQRYLLPVSHPGTMTGEELRVLDLSQRFYAGAEDLPPDLFDALLQRLNDAEKPNPFLATLVGYELVRRARHAEFRETLLPWLLDTLPDLPDIRVLASLCQPEKADEHLRVAAEFGLPAFAEGAMVLGSWLKQHPDLLTPRLEAAFRNLATGSPWTAWTVRQPLIEVKQDTPNFKALPYWEELETQQEALVSAAEAVGRLDLPNGGSATAFAVGSSRIATALFLAESLLALEGGKWRWRSGENPRWIGGRDDEETIEVLAAGADFSSLPGAAVLQLARPIQGVKPLQTAAPAQLRCAKVATIGYGRNEEDTRFGCFVAPGIIVGTALTRKRFEHDCTTRPGFAGAPVIELASGAVVGIHEGALPFIRQTDQKHDKRGYALALQPMASAASQERAEVQPLRQRTGEHMNGSSQELTLNIPLKIYVQVGAGQGASAITGEAPMAEAAAPSPEAAVYYDEEADSRALSRFYGRLRAGNDPARFYTQLHDLLASKHKKKLPYRPAQFLYPVVDRRPSSDIVSIYSGESIPPEELARDRASEAALDALERELSLLEANEEVVRMQMENLEASLPFNCEHVVPQSWFRKRDPMKGDLHHLFACEMRCNSFRGNLPFTEFLEERVMEDCGRAESGQFQPRGGRGAVARATLYFLLRYPGEINNQSGEYRREDIETLLRWHEDFPVDLYERHRNAEIEKLQGNRNPLIDHPEWAHQIAFARGLGSQQESLEVTVESEEKQIANFLESALDAERTNFEAQRAIAAYIPLLRASYSFANNKPFEMPQGYESMAEIRANIGELAVPENTMELVDPRAQEAVLNDAQAMVKAVDPSAFGFVVREISTGSVIIVIRGTQIPEEWRENFTAVPNPLSIVPGFGLAHLGFERMHRSVRQSIEDAMADVDANTRITVLGHGLGGAMAIIAAIDLKRNMGKRRVDVCTLGGPRVGKIEFRLRFNREIPDCVRIVNNADFVPRVPLVITGWNHVGKEIEVDGQLDDPHSLDAYAAGLQRLGDYRELGVAAAAPETVLEGVLGTPRQAGVIALRTV